MTKETDIKAEQLKGFINKALKIKKAYTMPGILEALEDIGETHEGLSDLLKTPGIDKVIIDIIAETNSTFSRGHVTWVGFQK